MAELVHKRTEEMLPELEQLQRVQIFTAKEIKAIIKKRTKHEYKLVRRSKQKQDFLAYVKYEVDLLALIRNRRVKIQYFFKHDEIEYSIVSRIHRLFKQMTLRWSYDLQLWISHAAFCIKWNKKIQLSKLCSKFLQIHGNKPQMWILAAKWEIECCDSMEKGRLLFMQAVKLHPNNKKLWLEFFRAELIFAEKMRRRMKLLSSDVSVDDLESVEGKFMEGRVAMIVLNNAIEAIPEDAGFHTKFLELTSCFLESSPFALNILQKIQLNLEEKYFDDHTARSALAKLQLNPKAGRLPCEVQDEDLQQKYCDERCWEEFEKAVQDLDTVEMWGEYIDCALSLCNEKEKVTHILGDADEKSLSRNRLHQAIKVILKAHAQKKISIDKYLVIVQFLLQNGFLVKSYDILNDVCDRCVEPKLLLQRIEIRLMLSVDDDKQSKLEKIDDIFLTTSKHVRNMTTSQQKSFWSLWMRYAILNEDNNLAKSITKEFSAESSSAVTSEMINLYLNWVAVTSGVHTAYQIFSKEICVVRTPPLELFNNILQLLQSSPETSCKTIEDCFDLSLRAYGTVAPDLWLKYIQYCNKVDGNRKSNVGQIYWRAKKTLEPSLTEKFVAGFTLLEFKDASP